MGCECLLGDALFNFKALTMALSFPNRERCCFVGDVAKVLKQAALHCMVHLVLTGILLFTSIKRARADSSLHPNIASILQAYLDVFNESKGLYLHPADRIIGFPRF